MTIPRARKSEILVVSEGDLNAQTGEISPDRGFSPLDGTPLLPTEAELRAITCSTTARHGREGMRVGQLRRAWGLGADAAAAIATASDRSEDLTRRRGERIDALMVVKALFGREFGWV